MRATTASLPLPLRLPASGTWRDSAAGGRERKWLPARLGLWHARRPRLPPPGVLLPPPGFFLAGPGPQWRESLALPTVNLAVSLLFVFTGLMLGREPGQRVTAWALILAGIFR